MTLPNVDHVLMGLIVAFDAETGDVLQVHQKIVETEDGEAVVSKDITAEESDSVRAVAARLFPRRRVAVIVVPPEVVPPEGQRVRYHVDPQTRKLRVESLCDPHLEAGFSSQ